MELAQPPNQIVSPAFKNHKMPDLFVGEHDPLGDERGVLDAQRVRPLPRDVALPQIDLLRLLGGARGRHLLWNKDTKG